MFQLTKYDNIIVPVVELLCMHVVLLEYPCNGVHVLIVLFFYSAIENVFAFPGEDLTGQRDTLDEEIASQISESEEGVPIEDSPQHTEPQDNKDTCDTSQQGSNLSSNQHEDMDKDGE